MKCTIKVRIRSKIDTENPTMQRTVKSQRKKLSDFPNTFTLAWGIRKVELELFSLV